MRRVIPLLACAPLLAAQPVRFAAHEIARGLSGGYQVVIADLNHDGKPDLIALASGLPELVWYENPTWERHVIAGGQSRMINCAVVGADADGIPEIVLASEFSNNPKSSAGVVSVLRHRGDPRNPWTATEIDRLPSAHRLRVADIDGSGHPVVLNAPLAASDAAAPDFRGATPLVFYRPGEWKRVEIQPRNQGLVHGIHAIDWDGDGRDEILTAGFEGLHLFKLAKDGSWTRTRIAAGDPAPWPKSGSSDVAVGRLGKERFLAAIEPWHGNQVAVYRAPKAASGGPGGGPGGGAGSGAWERNVIDASLVDGHTIQTADLARDGRDAIVAGYRGQGRSVYIYWAADATGDKWTKQILDDGGMGAAACAIGDLNGDGRLDIACIGSATANLKWYENLGPASAR